MKTTRSDEAKTATGNGLNGLMPTITCLLLFLTLFTAGCSHTLTVKNIDKYQNIETNSLNKSLTIGIVSNYSKPDDLKLLDGIATSLESYSAKVIRQYTHESKDEADVVATISIRSRYEGSGKNFWVNFPGFLVWAPAWNGYIYEVNHAVDVKLANASGTQFEKFTLPIELDVRHSGINRTWTELSWLEFGVIAFVGGICFMDYDEKVTPLLADSIQKPVGNYISQEIIKRINGHMDVVTVSGVSPSLGN